jgi:HAD superfamily hydrolase (TIGR01484 family)
MSRAAWVLATDLDGTFAGGTRRDIEELLAALAAQDVDLIYVTGRSVPSARQVVAREALPVPRVLIADVGTSVLRGIGPERMARIEDGIAARWPGSREIREALSRVAGLEPQEVAAPRRVSYWIADNRSLRSGAYIREDFEARPPSDASLSEGAERVARSVAARAAAALHRLDVDVLVSANVYLDVLPRGISKGSTLLRVLAELNLDATNCVVAGDSLNDRSLFEIGARGIVVGNCEPTLRAVMSGRSGIYQAHADGAAGILEGLRFLQLLPDESAAEQSTAYGQ